MIDPVKTLLNKTFELEEKIKKISNNQNISSNTNNYTCFSKGTINLSFLQKNQILLATFETLQNSPLYFQNQIELNVPVSQNVKISLIINNIAIFRSTRKLQEGYNQLTIMKNYIPLKNEQVELYLKIETEENALITIISDTLFVWGLNNVSNDIEYHAVETQDKFLLSYLNNNCIYYAFENKSEAELNSDDFTYYANGISFSFVYFEPLNSVFLFRVDSDGNLFYCNFDNKNEMFLSSNVSYVSCTSNSEIILVVIIKDQQCYNFEINTSLDVTNEILINTNNIFMKKCYAYFNKFNDKFYVIMSDKYNSNYIIENAPIKSIGHYQISASYSILTLTYEANL